MDYKMVSGNKKSVLAGLFVVMTLLSLLLPCFATAASSYSLTLGTPVSGKVSVLTDTGGKGSVITTVSPGETVTVLSTVADDSGKTWYLVRSDWGYEGYVSQESLSVETKTFSSSTVPDYSSFLASISQFPESYYPGLLYLHTLYPSWKFVAQK